MTKPIRTTAGADVQILAVDAWWREHRDKAPNAFVDELAAAFRTISAAPRAAKIHRHRVPRVRRVLLPTTRHHVYYVEREDHILVIAIWGGARGSGPDLRRLG